MMGCGDELLEDILFLKQFMMESSCTYIVSMINDPTIDAQGLADPVGGDDE